MVAWLIIAALVAFMVWTAWLGSKCGETKPRAHETHYGSPGGGLVEYGPLTDEEMEAHETLRREMGQ